MVLSTFGLPLCESYSTLFSGVSYALLNKSWYCTKIPLHFCLTVQQLFSASIFFFLPGYLTLPHLFTAEFQKVNGLTWHAGSLCIIFLFSIDRLRTSTTDQNAALIWLFFGFFFVLGLHICCLCVAHIISHDIHPIMTFFVFCCIQLWRTQGRG